MSEQVIGASLAAVAAEGILGKRGPSFCLPERLGGGGGGREEGGSSEVDRETEAPPLVRTPTVEKPGRCVSTSLLFSTKDSCGGSGQQLPLHSDAPQMKFIYSTPAQLLFPTLAL